MWVGSISSHADRHSIVCGRELILLDVRHNLYFYAVQVAAFLQHTKDVKPPVVDTVVLVIFLANANWWNYIHVSIPALYFLNQSVNASAVLKSIMYAILRKPYIRRLHVL